MLTLATTYRVVFDITKDARPDDISGGWFTLWRSRTTSSGSSWRVWSLGRAGASAAETISGIAFVLARTFEQLADQFVVAIFPFYALAAAAVFVLRRRRPDLPRPVRVWGYPAVPFLFVLASLVILGNALREHPGATGLAFGGILLGVPVYFLWSRMRPHP